MMRTKWMRFPALTTVALSLVLWSCDSLSEPAGGMLGPGESRQNLVTNTTKSGYTIVKETDASVGAVTGVIDQNGGRIAMGQHVLEVPAGAVTAATTFTMTKLDTDQVKVSLTATRLVPNDVGSSGFAVPVSLTLSYKSAAQAPENERELKILWVKPDGSTQAQSSRVDVQGKRVTGSLHHFSDYAIGFPNVLDAEVSVGGDDGLGVDISLF